MCNNNYCHISFSIHTQCYYGNGMQIGFQNEAERENFYGEIKKLFESKNWTVKGYCEVQKGKSLLYIHPQQITGEVFQDFIPEIVSILNSATMSKLQGYSIGETIYDLSADQEMIHLAKHTVEIKERLLNFCKVSRKNHYKILDFWVRKEICRPFIIPALDEREENKAIIKFVETILNELIKSGEVIQKNLNGKHCYRLPFKTELPRKRERQTFPNPMQSELF